MRQIVWLTVLVVEARSFALASPHRNAHRWIAPSDTQRAFLTDVSPKVPSEQVSVGIDALSAAMPETAVVVVHEREIHEPTSGWSPLAGGKSALPLLLDRIPPEVVLVIFSRSARDELWSKREALRASAPERLGTVAFLAPAFSTRGDGRLVAVVEALASGMPPVGAMGEVRHELVRLKDAWPPQRELTPFAQRLIGAYGAQVYGLATVDAGIERVFRESPRPNSIIRSLEDWARDAGWEGK